MHDATIAQGLIPALLSGYTLSIVAPWLNKKLRELTGWIIALLPFALFIYFATLIDDVASGQVLVAYFEWVPSLQVNLSFVVDGWGLFMALIVSGMGTLVIIYASSYLKGHAQLGRFYTFILIFMASMLVLVLADNVFLMFIAWELTSISSFFLIGFYHEKENSQKSALQALLVTGAGGLAMLAGLIVLTAVTDTASFQQIQAERDVILASGLYLPILILILLGAFTKSAQFPFHFWLPNAMAGPAPVSTYLHSATMVKAGVYLLARLNPTLGGTEEWLVMLASAGAITALLGAWLSWQKTDLKALLAYSTISALGTLVLLIGIGTKLAIETAVLFLLIHALYKGGLFMAAGIIDHETGTRDVRELGGLRRLMPFTFVGVLLATLSMAGIPPLLGFVGKELMYETALSYEGYAYLLLGVLLLTNILMVAAAAILLIRPFFGAQTEAKPHHKTPFAMWLGPVLLGITGLLFGLAVSTEFINGALLSPAVSAVYGKEIHLHLALWHGLTPMLGLSAITLLGGFGFFAIHKRLQTAFAQNPIPLTKMGPERWYQWILDGTLAFAGAFARAYQNGKLRYYLMYVMVTFLFLVGGTLILLGPVNWSSLELTSARLPEAILSLVILAAILTIVRVRSRLTAVAMLGVIGYGIAVFYILFSAPDLAMTQFSIETLTVILFVLVLYRLPRFEQLSSKKTRTRDAFIAIAVGLLMAGLTLAAQTVSSSSVLTDYFTENSYKLAKGHNIVNVILVDFRGFDTMVEITVLSVAAIGVYALLKSRPRQNGEKETLSPPPTTRSVDKGDQS